MAASASDASAFEEKYCKTNQILVTGYWFDRKSMNVCNMIYPSSATTRFSLKRHISAIQKYSTAL